ncbi:ArsR family transcriptional regulator [Candidatus Woesearchaeota archaeon]|nr:ArsR family transcriptional regulator [Candidatus Woesearchaeota archaeon]
MTRRPFPQIRKLILLRLSKGQSTINKISTETNINWKTVEGHLTYLIGKGLVREIFSSEYVRIFDLTSKGKDFISSQMKPVIEYNDSYEIGEYENIREVQ